MEFGYNNAPHKTTNLSHFKIVYGLDPSTPRDLAPRAIGGKLSAEEEKRVKKI